MGLKEKIKDFNLRDNEGIDKDDNNGKISEAFKPIAETILSGHFKVTKNNSDSYVTVHPTCVEMYYHEEGEGEDKIKDYIVYHRDSNDGKNKKDIFPLGVLHNHVSGIDLTFEREGNDHEPIRFSALIREFWVNMENLADFVSRNKNLQVADLQRLKSCFGELVTATTSDCPSPWRYAASEVV